MKNSSLETNPEKRQNRFLFCCIGMILYTMPCMSCLMIPFLTEGMTTSNMIAAGVVLLGIAAGFIGISRYRAKRGRIAVILTAAVLMLLHFFAAFLIGEWYIILAPEFILLVLMIVWSDVIDNQ